MTALSQVNLAHKLSLYFVAGTTNCQSPESFRDILVQAVKGGVTTFQYREKGANALRGEKRLEMAKRAKKICRDHGVLFIVNDDLELMKQVDADGLHVGQTDGSLAFIRKETEGKVLGVSTHTLAEAINAVDHGADYIGAGPVYATVTKPDAQEPVGPEFIKMLRANGIAVPIVGIGGISLENTKAVIEAGADGAAIISAISQAEDPKKACRELLFDILEAKRGL
ncbi:thiamine phosphate synthase [Fictibacillus phosphorivorans]|uniref:thiamine phosphate synthase n=1 Tax=Fictibacillus phosphorivorans TaxID=1221500 RepID=UPI0020419B64|nr:thiamine phosphate synthase [Fictibacillus phosphorivorans]MCM3719276.1 thiamine phosphate synthase [Fictibacillus phosphorivorans]MCM3776898.1 thiamine phosphate synthase [Fictibacillus phosphorivorans]